MKEGAVTAPGEAATTDADDVSGPYKAMLFGLFVFMGLTWLFSWKPTKLKLRPVIGALFLQYVFGYVVIQTKWGFTNAIDCLGDPIRASLAP